MASAPLELGFPYTRWLSTHKGPFRPAGFLEALILSTGLHRPNDGIWIYSNQTEKQDSERLSVTSKGGAKEIKLRRLGSHNGLNAESLCSRDDLIGMDSIAPSADEKTLAPKSEFVGISSEFDH